MEVLIGKSPIDGELSADVERKYGTSGLAWSRSCHVACVASGEKKSMKAKDTKVSLRGSIHDNNLSCVHVQKYRW